MDVERLARILHESAREAVAVGAVVNKAPGQPFYEWDQLTEPAEGRRLQAAYLLERFTVQPFDSPGL